MSQRNLDKRRYLWYNGGMTSEIAGTRKHPANAVEHCKQLYGTLQRLVVGTGCEGSTPSGNIGGIGLIGHLRGFDSLTSRNTRGKPAGRLMLNGRLDSKSSNNSLNYQKLILFLLTNTQPSV